MKDTVFQSEAVLAVGLFADWADCREAGVLAGVEEKPLVNRLLPGGRPSLAAVVGRLAAKQSGEPTNPANQRTNNWFFWSAICTTVPPCRPARPPPRPAVWRGGESGAGAGDRGGALPDLDTRHPAGRAAGVAAGVHRGGGAGRQGAAKVGYG